MKITNETRGLKKTTTSMDNLNKEIAERKKAEQELRDNEKLFRSIFEITPGFLVITDAKGNNFYPGPNCEEFTGYTREELIGKITWWVHEEDTPRAKELFERTFKEGTGYRNFEYRMVKKNGEVVYVSSSWEPLKDDKGNLKNVVFQTIDITERKQAESQRDATLETLKKLNKDLAAREKAATKMLYDLSETHEELKKTQGQLIQSAKLASLGELAAGVAHEINNPTGFIGNNLTSLNKYIANLSEIVGTAITLKDAVTTKNMEGAAKAAERITGLEKKLDIHYIIEDSANLLKESQEGIDRIKNIVANLRIFSRTDEKMDALCNLNEILDQTLNIVWNEIKYKAEVKKRYGDIPTVKGNLQQLEQVFINLLLNASQSIEKKGTIAVHTYTKDKKNYVEISDTGKGISPETIDKIFDPFFTSKEVGKGMGLGLSISYGIIKKHNGAIYVESTPGKGTKFTVCLPVSDEPTPRRSPATTR